KTTMETNTLTGKIYTIIDWIVKLVFINILFIISNIPTTIAFINFMIANTKGEMIFAILLLAGMIILCLFPSVMAVFGVIRALTIDGRTIRSFRTYIKTYKENYIRSISGGTLFIIVAITCSFYYFFLNLQANIIIQYM